MTPVSPVPDGTWRLSFGILLVVGGIAGTALFYLFAGPDPRLVLGCGAVAYGFFELSRGAAAWWRVRARVGFPWARVVAALVVPIIGASAVAAFPPRVLMTLKEARNERARQQLLELVREHREKRFPGRTPPPEQPAIAGSSVPQLIEALSAPDAYRRQRAAQELGLREREAADAIPALTKALDDPAPEVRASVIYALGRVDPTGSRSGAFVAQRISDSAPEVRVEAGRALSRMGLKGGIETLVKELRSSDPHARELAASALETVDTAAAVPALIECVEGDSSARARASCVLAIRRGGKASVRALPALARALQDRDPEVRKCAATAYLAVKRIADALPLAVPAEHN